MATYILYQLLTNGEWCWKVEYLNLFGNIITLIFSFIMIFVTTIILVFVALIENIFMTPVWVLYNLCCKKEYRKSYVEFFKFKEEMEDDQ